MTTKRSRSLDEETPNPKKQATSSKVVKSKPRKQAVSSVKSAKTEPEYRKQSTSSTKTAKKDTEIEKRIKRLEDKIEHLNFVVKHLVNHTKCGQPIIL